MLAVTESSVVGIHADGDRVIFRASGNQWTNALILFLFVVVGGLVVFALTAETWLVPAVLAAAVLLIGWTALLRRISVVLSPSGVCVQGRLLHEREYRWERIDSVHVEIGELQNLWPRGYPRPTMVQGVMLLADGKVRPGNVLSG